MTHLQKILHSKGVAITIALFILSYQAIAQQDIIHDHRWLIMMKRELDLSKTQVNKLSAIDKHITAKINFYDRRYTRKTAAKKSAELFKLERNKILSVLTQEQQERGIMILDQQPRRGVTDMPNERKLE